MVITDGGEEFTDDAMEALRRNVQKNSCNLSQEGTKAESGHGGDPGSPRDLRRSPGNGRRSGVNDDDDDSDDDGVDKDSNYRDVDNDGGDGDGNNDRDGHDDSNDDDDGVLGGREGRGAGGADVIIERLTWGDHTDFLERNADGGGGGGANGGGGFDFIVAADVICELGGRF